MQGAMVVDVPPVLVGYVQRHKIAVSYLNLTRMGTLRPEGGRQRQEVGMGFPDERPDCDDYYQQGTAVIFFLRLLIFIFMLTWFIELIELTGLIGSI